MMHLETTCHVPHATHEEPPSPPVPAKPNILYISGMFVDIVHLFYRHNLSYHDLLSTACNILWFKVMPHSKSTNKRILFPEAPFCTVCTQWRGNTLAQTA